MVLLSFKLDLINASILLDICSLLSPKYSLNLLNSIESLSDFILSIEYVSKTILKRRINSCGKATCDVEEFKATCDVEAFKALVSGTNSGTNSIFGKNLDGCCSCPDCNSLFNISIESDCVLVKSIFKLFLRFTIVNSLWSSSSP